MARVVYVVDEVLNFKFQLTLYFAAVDHFQVTISNDGATIMNLLDIVHPAAKTLVDIAKSQDAEVGDGTTTVVLLAGALLSASKQFIEDGVHAQIVIKVRTCCPRRT